MTAAGFVDWAVFWTVVAIALVADIVVARLGGRTPTVRNADPDASAFPQRERLLLRLVDELHDTSEVSDPLWLELRTEWTDEQLIELVALVGQYHLISFVTNAFRIPRESYAARFPANPD